MRIRFLDDARDEFDAAIDWYAERSVIAAERFRSLVANAIEQLAATPRAAPMWPDRNDLRAWPLSRFPFSLVYLLDNDQLVIVAVAHASRRPGYWRDRLAR